jgi:prepilin peptidase CpaA
MDGQGIALIGLAMAFPVLLAVGAISDLARYMIPNWIALALAIAAVPALFMAGADAIGVAWHLATGAVVLILTSILFFRGWLGGGDVKLLAAAACWTGWALVLPLIVYTALAGGILALILMAARRILRNHAATSTWIPSLFGESSNVPYGAAIATGGWLVWAKLPIFAAAFPT